MTVASVVRETACRTEVVALTENDLPEIAGFIASRSGRTKQAVESHLRWFLLQNPARKPQYPLGFGLRSQDRLVGCILYNPQTFQINHRIIDLMGSSCFYVDEAFRGQGARIFLRCSRIPAPFLGTSANADAAALWKAAGANPIPFSDGELFGVLHWPPVAEEFAHRKFSNRALNRLAASPISKLAKLCRALKLDVHPSGSLRPLESAEEAHKLLTDRFAEDDLSLRDPFQKITALRDLPYIRWRYFSAHDKTTAAFAFRSHSAARESMVTVNVRKRGYREQITALNVLDVYPEATVEQWLEIVGALVQHYGRSVDAVVLRDQNLESRKLFSSRGFIWRAFDAPTGWLLDKGNRLLAQAWYLVPADGDALI
jgi:hypothetical protein